MPTKKTFDELSKILADSLTPFFKNNMNVFCSTDYDEWFKIAEELIREAGWTLEDYRAEIINRVNRG